MKRRHMAMGLALVSAAGLLVFGDRSPQGEVAPPAPPVRGAATTTAPVKPEPAIARLVPREILLGKAGGGADSLFGRQDWTPPPPPPPPPAPPPPPTAPPLPFTVIGKSLEDGKWEVYLASGQNTHIAHEGAVLDGAWRIERIAPPLMTLTYLPLNHVQQLNIGGFE
jgi:hypothetical protein